MIAALSAAGVSAQGVYPGGQSENPASPWYAHLVGLWWDGKYLPVPGATAGATARVIAALAGLLPYAGVTVAVTTALALLQVLAGAWLGRAVLPGRR
jgi:hypothetical protein